MGTRSSRQVSTPLVSAQPGTLAHRTKPLLEEINSRPETLFPCPVERKELTQCTRIVYLALCSDRKARIEWKKLRELKGRLR